MLQTREEHLLLKRAYKICQTTCQFKTYNSAVNPVITISLEFAQLSNTDALPNMPNILYLDCYSGIAGDMTISALVDAGADRTVLNDRLNTLTRGSATLSFDRVQRHGAEGLHLHIDPPDTSLPHDYTKIRDIISDASLADRITHPAISALDRLAEVEADYHGCELEEVHFHEVAGFDLLVDLVGAAVCLDNLNVDQMYYPDVPVSSGWLDSHHGRLPVPAPAVLGLLTDVRVYDSGLEEEITTPTGAAILTSMGQQTGGMPDMKVSSIGYGAGTKELSDRSNLLRAVLGSAETTDSDGTANVSPQRVCEMQTNLDDATPELIAHTMEELMEAGALDVFVSPVTMKKNRPGHLLTVLCEPEDQAKLSNILFEESSTFGIRTSIKNRTVLPRSVEEVETSYGTVRVKIGYLNGTRKVSPEFDDCKQRAEEHDCTVSEVMKQAREAWTET